MLCHYFGEIYCFYFFRRFCFAIVFSISWYLYNDIRMLNTEYWILHNEQLVVLLFIAIASTLIGLENIHLFGRSKYNIKNRINEMKLRQTNDWSLIFSPVLVFFFLSFPVQVSNIESLLWMLWWIHYHQGNEGILSNSDGPVLNGTAICVLKILSHSSFA